MKRLLYLFLGTVFCGVHVHGVEVRRGSAPGERAGLVIDSALLKVGIVPELGGRIVELIPKRVYKNYLRIAPRNFGMGPEDGISAGDYGGIFDCPSETWPGGFWALRYSAKPITAGDAVGVRVSAERGSIRIVRDMLVPQGESRLIIRTRQTNTGDVPRDMVTRLHGDFRIGTMADEDDVFCWPEATGLRNRPCLPWPVGESALLLPVAKGWTALIDTKEREVLIHRSAEPAEGHRVSFGVHQPLPDADGRREPPWCAISRVGDSRAVAPGATIQAEEQLWPLTGLAQVDFCTEFGAGSLAINRSRLGSEEQVVFTTAFAAPVALKDAEVNLTIFDAEKEAVLNTNRHLADAAAGVASALRFAWDTSTLPDGVYRAVATFTREDVILGATHRRFEIAAALIHAAKTAAANLRGKLNSVTTDWSDERATDRRRRMLLESFVSGLESDLRNGRFERVNERAPHVDAAIDRAVRLRRTEMPDFQARTRELAPILLRYRSSEDKPEGQ